jgi:hypothetical protein
VKRRRRRIRIVRSKDEQRLRDAVHQLLANGYDIGQIARLVLDAEDVLDLIEGKEPRAKKAAQAKDTEGDK